MTCLPAFVSVMAAHLDSEPGEKTDSTLWEPLFRAKRPTPNGPAKVGVAGLLRSLVRCHRGI